MTISYQKLYEAFSMYHMPKTFDACPCCMDEKEKNILLSKHITKLSAEELHEYASSVFLTVGGVSDFKYFFPRIFELCLEEKFSWPGPEVVFKSISNANWVEWLEDEKEAVLTIVKRKFEALLTNNPVGSDIDSWLCAIANIQPDLSSYLDSLYKNENEEAFIDFISWNIGSYTNGKLDNGFWENCPTQEKQVVDWMKKDKAKNWLYNKYGMRI